MTARELAGKAKFVDGGVSPITGSRRRAGARRRRIRPWSTTGAEDLGRLAVRAALDRLARRGAGPAAATSNR